MLKKLALVLMLLITVYLVIPDSDLSSGAVDWMMGRQPLSGEQDNLFNGLAGLTVAAEQDFIKSGTQLVQAANTQLAIFLEAAHHLQSGARPDFDKHWYQPALRVTEGVNILCEPRNQDCRNIWISQKDTIFSLQKDNQVLLQRYDKLQNLSTYHTTLAADIRSPQPDYATLMAINRLLGAAIATRFLTGEPEPALAMLNQDIHFLRGLLAKADTLIAKMIALAMLKHDLYIYASLMDAPGELTYLFEDIRPLNEEERSFYSPILYEFRMNTNLAEEIKTYPELITGDLGVPAWLPFPLFRKNHTINMLQETFNEILERSRIPASSFHQYLQQKPQREEGLQPGWMDYVYNPIGCILFSLSLPDFDKYIVRMHDTQGLINMINLKLDIRKNGVKPESLSDYVHEARKIFSEPYTGKAFEWDPVERSLSFTSPDGINIRNSLQLSFDKEESAETETPDS